jgi:polysaccharide biosynthesis/export protein
MFSLISVTAAHAQSHYSIRAGDVLQIEVLEDSSLTRSALVLPDGTINFPYVGTLRVAGHTVDQVRKALTTGIAPNFAATPTVYVSIGSLGTRVNTNTAATGGKLMTVYAMGEVAKTGPLEVPAGTTLLQMLAQSGGFTKFAATKRVELHRIDPQTGAETVTKFDMRNGAGSAGATRLQPGDVIVVPQRRLFELG